MSTIPTICLLIDDDRDDHEIFQMAIHRIGKSIKVYTANNGFEGLKKLKEKNGPVPDYIFLDLNMPGMDGKECLKELKKNNSLKHIPVIMYSTSSDEKDIKETKELGANRFITKPTSFTKLTEVLQDFFSKVH